MMRILLGAFGDPGHAFPMLALGEALTLRGHDVCLQTWRRWREHVEAGGMAFSAAPEYQVFPTRERPLKPYEAAVRAARETAPLVEDFAPEVVVHDILTVAPALAAELRGVPAITLVPHVHPDVPDGFPPYSIGARLPRTRLGAALWRQTRRLIAQGLEQGRREYNETRARLGLPPLPWVHTGLSRELTLVGTLPQLEYPRAWPDWVRLVGPLLWEPPGAKVEPPEGDGPIVLVAPSTSQDPEQALVRAALAGLADEPVRVIAVGDSRPLPTDTTGEPARVVATAAGDPLPAPANAIVVPWLSYSKTMPACDLVVLHGGHGTLARALVSGCPVVVCPAAGDMAESGARVDWAGLGVRLPRRLLSARTLRLAVRRALGEPGMRARALAVAEWARSHDGAATAADELERWAQRSAPAKSTWK